MTKTTMLNKTTALLTPEVKRNSDYEIDGNKNMDDFNSLIMQSLQESSAFFK